MDSSESLLPFGCLINAAIFSTISFAALLIGVPLMLKDVASLHYEMAQQQKIYMEMSNNMWREIMGQNKMIRTVRATFSGARTRRQQQSDQFAYNGITSRGDEDACAQGPRGAPGVPGEPGQDGAAGVPGQPSAPVTPNELAPSANSVYNRLEGANATAAETRVSNVGDGVAGPAPVIEPAHSLSCTKCPAGPPGPPGYKGKRGPRGEKGIKGELGPPGRDGLIGDEGPEGEIGHEGDIGEPGHRGPPGEDGIGYARGVPGSQGDIGTSGPVGDEGPPGDRGDDAQPGFPGEPGPQGPHGEPGKDGAPGTPGPIGPQGADAEYCPCPDRSEADGHQQVSPELTKVGHGHASAAVPSTVEASNAYPRAAAAFAATAADGYPSYYYSHSKLAHANALRRRHLSR